MEVRVRPLSGDARGRNDPEVFGMSAHLWKRLIESEQHRKLLVDAKVWLHAAWERDQKYPEAYPMNTSHALAQILERLSIRPKREDAGLLMPEPTAPTRLADLLPENLLQMIWEEHHSGSFARALEKAAGFDCDSSEESLRSFTQILQTIKTTYKVVRFGSNLLPQPKANILHRGLERIALAATSDDDLDEKWFSIFLDDLCPCGLRSHGEAVRKLNSRKRKAR